MQAPDPRPGFYYVSVIDGPRRALLRGPWVDDHAGALAAVDRVRRQAELVDARAVFYAFGTARTDVDRGPGVLGRAFVGHLIAPAPHTPCRR